MPRRNPAGARILTALLGATMLAGCVGWDTPRLEPGQSLVLLRSTGFNPRESELWNLDTEQRMRTTDAPQQWRPVARQRVQANDWWQTALAPARYVIRFGDGTSLGFQVPGQATRLYIGTVSPECATDRYVAGCEPPGLVRDERATAAEILAAQAPALGGPATELATPFDVSATRRGWPGASRIEASVAPDAWRAAINWHEFINRGNSRAFLRGGGGLIGFGLQVGGALGSVTAGYGAALGVPFAAAGAGIGAFGLLIAATEETAEQIRRHQLTPCLEGLSAQLAPAAVTGRIASSIPAPDASTGRGGRAARTTVPWQASITRLVLRRCEQAGSYGLEVGSRWSVAGRDTRFVRSVTGAMDDQSLSHPSPAPWEAELASTAPCRPFIRYCEADGAALLQQDVIDALTAARDALAAGR